MLSACNDQGHVFYNAFNVLANEGFLRDDQGILTLESIQTFYESINQKPKRATLETPDLHDICNKFGFHKLCPQPVISVVQRREEYDENDQIEWKHYYHNFAVKFFDKAEDCFELITADDEKLECQMCPKDSNGEILWDQMSPEEWYLEDRKCYYFLLN